MACQRASSPVLVDKSNVKEFLDSFDTFMTDCDGKYVFTEI